MKCTRLDFSQWQADRQADSGCRSTARHKRAGPCKLGVYYAGDSGELGLSCHGHYDYDCYGKTPLLQQRPGATLEEILYFC